MFKLLIMMFVATINMNAAAKYVLDCDARLLKMSGILAFRQVDVIENGRNRGEMIEKYQQSVGLAKGQPYCAAGQYWCFSEACKILKMDVSMVPLPRTGLANAMYDFAKRFGRRVHYKPERDDLIVWRRGKSIFGHIERVVYAGEGGEVYTIGFNTIKYVGNKRYEGVFLHRRNLYHFLGRLYVRGIIGFNGRRFK